jgi:hypothetical protein
MTTKIATDLLEEVKRAEQTSPPREIPIIITLNGPANLKELEEKGLKIIHSIELLPGVSGTVTPDKLPALAELPQVKTIEFDGEFGIASA